MNSLLDYGSLVLLVEKILICNDFPPEVSSIVAQSLVEAEASGVRSHGIGRLKSYVDDSRKGILVPDAKPRIVESKGSVSVIDCGHGSGIYCGAISADITAEKARKYGTSASVLRDLHHSGMLQFLSHRIAFTGLIGIVMCNAHPVVAAPGSNVGILGTNPVSISVSGATQAFDFDFAISESSLGKIREAVKNSASIPEGWAVDKNGDPTTNAEEAMKGALTPSGGFKGFGIGMAVDILAGVLSGSSAGPEVITWNDEGKYWNNGMFMMALDPSFFGDANQFRMKIDKYLDIVRSGTRDTSIPGDRRRKMFLNSRENGVSVPEPTLLEIMTLAKECGLNFEAIIRL